eukprot:CAMPEP_0204355492 /NCGR_PEP_ID=MMETSP0469-20131031/34176_1 /ASSEMBLY_ACC=CAM_ASM_000384 /TAXON_ID=2969 /ORGANISM="Oxyrrhis marina" /LENGTH=512 /DNA_ID=CAMNT_0051342749 /DNA_START=8 /DNA_END=1544 /DNA_ORIENTATION=+
MPSWGTVGTVVVVWHAFLYKLHLDHSFDSAGLDTSPVKSISGATGSLFKGNVVRHFVHSERRGEALGKSQCGVSSTGSSAPHCKFWSVVTTIYEPSQSIWKQTALPDWCTVIVGDKKTPTPYLAWRPEDQSRVVYLSPTDQEALEVTLPFISSVPWNHFGRKNIGYLFAIQHGAEVIWDFDDDNELKDGAAAGFAAPKEKVLARSPQLNGTVFNPYPSMGAQRFPFWPRGFPLLQIKDNATADVAMNEVEIDSSTIGVWQSLADNDPDVDAVLRMTQDLPMHFATRDNRAVVLPKGVFSPYNAQATMIMKRAFWGALLPITVHGRVSDIWRGLSAQRLGWDIGIQLAFLPPIVDQFRNAHNYLADMDSEADLYFKAEEFLSFLSAWSSNATSLPERIEDLWIQMYERTYVELKDVQLLQAWLDALICSGYEFPVPAWAVFLGIDLYGSPQRQATTGIQLDNGAMSDLTEEELARRVTQLSCATAVVNLIQYAVVNHSGFSLVVGFTLAYCGW